MATSFSPSSLFLVEGSVGPHVTTPLSSPLPPAYFVPHCAIVSYLLLLAIMGSKSYEGDEPTLLSEGEQKLC